jgi:hypothetical protein
MVSVPERDVIPRFASTRYVTVPLAVPILPLVMLTHGTLLTALHPQPVCVVTDTLPVSLFVE